MRALLLLLLCLAGTARAEPLKVMTFNIRYGTANDGVNHWKFRRDGVLRILREEAPAICGVQEALKFQLDEILAAVPGYARLGVGRDDGRDAGEFSPILVATSRFAVVSQETFWLSDTPGQPGSRTWGNTIPRICTLARLKQRSDGRALWVGNAHFDHLSANSRLKSAEAVAARLRDLPDPVLFLGDLNCGPDSEPVRVLLAPAAEGGGALVDLAAVNPALRAHGTFHGWNGGADGPHIDYVLGRGGWASRETRIRVDPGPPYPSDHYPVWMRLDWPAAPADPAP